MVVSKRVCKIVAAVFVVTACGKRDEAAQVESTRLSPSQALADFEAMVAAFQNLYGPLHFKEERFGFTFDTLTATTRDELGTSTGDADTFGALARFIASFHDGHLNISFPDNMNHFNSYDLPVYVAQAEGRAVVVKSELSDHLGGGAAIGDELVAIDGQKPIELLPALRRYGNLATAASTNYLLMQVTHRPFFIKELVPTSPLAVLDFARADGSTYRLEVPWVKTPLRKPDQNFALQRAGAKNFYARGVTALFHDPATPFLDFGAVTPFFTTSQVQAGFQLQPVALSAETVSKFTVDATALKDIYAATYTYHGKKILLLRQPSYDVSTTTVGNRMNAYRAILAQYQPQTDVLVLDQTHNPGGDLDYVTQFFSLFARSSASNLVEHLHADRKWIFDLQAEADAAAASTSQSGGTSAEATEYQYLAAQVDAAIDAGQTLTVPLPLVGFNQVMPDRQVTWTKPLLVLTDEMAGSCGDIFPMLIQRNHVAKTFGEATMGLGGNVDDGAITLPNSQAVVDITRGLYTSYNSQDSYQTSDLVENTGIAPDYPYDHTVADLRAGFVGYVTAFSEAALAQLQR